MKRLLNIFLLMLFVSINIFATAPLSDSDNSITTDSSSDLSNDQEELMIDNDIKKKVYIDRAFSINPLIGFTLSPFDSTDLHIASGLQFDFYKYYGYKNYGTYFKLSTLGESFRYGSYEVAFGGSYRFIPFKIFELFVNVGPTLSYYNERVKDENSKNVSLWYAGAEGAIGLRFYPFDDKDEYSFDIGLTGTYMWNIPLSTNVDNVLVSRYKVIGFVGYTYTFRGKSKVSDSKEN